MIFVYSLYSSIITRNWQLISILKRVQAQSKNSNYEYFIHQDQMDCAICLAVPDTPEIVPCCQKAFCRDCLSSWVSVRNCCPLCIAPLGPQKLNQLTHNHSQEFDNGGLMLENELAVIMEKIKFLRMIYDSKLASANNFKTTFPKAHLNFVREQMRSVEDNLEIAQLSVEENDRSTATLTIQNMAEALLDIEGLLMGETTIEMDVEDDSEEEEDYEDDYDQIQEEFYQRKDKKEKYKAATKTNSKKRIPLN